MPQMLDDYPFVKTFLMYVVGFVCGFIVLQAFQAWRRWRKGERAWSPADLREPLDSAVLLLWLCALLAVTDQKAWSTWQTIAALAVVTGLMTVVTTWSARRRFKQKQAEASTNPLAANDAAAPQPPPIDWETEKRQAMILLPALAIYIGMIFAIIWGGKALDWPVQARAGLALAWMIGIPVLLAFARWPGRLSQRHTLVIAASPEKVWDTLHCRETNDYYRKPCVRIAQVPDAENSFIWHYGDVGYCGCCGLPKSQAHSTQRIHVEVTEQLVGRSARQISTFPEGTPFQCQLYRFEDNSFDIRPHAEGAEVTYEVSVVGPRVWMLALMAADSIPRALLVDLKSYLEGTEGSGVFANGRRHIEFAQASPKLCGCA